MGKKYPRRGEKVQRQQGERSHPAPWFIHYVSYPRGHLPVSKGLKPKMNLIKILLGPTVITSTRQTESSACKCSLANNAPYHTDLNRTKALEFSKIFFNFLVLQ